MEELKNSLVNSLYIWKGILYSHFSDFVDFCASFNT
jgi:hypothetical protein